MTAKASEANSKRTPSRKGVSELVALDLAFTGVKAVRVRKLKGRMEVLGVDMLPPIRFNESHQPSAALTLPKHLLANYASLAVSGESSVVRLLTLPGQPAQNDDLAGHIREHIGVDGDYRYAHTILAPSGKGGAKQETRVVAVAMPEPVAQG